MIEDDGLEQALRALPEPEVPRSLAARIIGEVLLLPQEDGNAPPPACSSTADVSPSPHGSRYAVGWAIAGIVLAGGIGAITASSPKGIALEGHRAALEATTTPLRDASPVYPDHPTPPILADVAADPKAHDEASIPRERHRDARIPALVDATTTAVPSPLQPAGPAATPQDDATSVASKDQPSSNLVGPPDDDMTGDVQSTAPDGVTTQGFGFRSTDSH